MKLIVISYPKYLKGEHKAIIQMMENSTIHFHLRKPDFSENDIRVYLEKIPSRLHKRVILHSHYSLARKLDLGGVHFSKKTISQRNDWDLLPEKTKSASCHSFHELETYGNSFDYLFISPIFDSISKKGYYSNFKKEELSSFLKKWRNKSEIIALGGVSPKNIKELKKIGFHGCAVLGCVWEPLTDEKADMPNDTIQNLLKSISE